MESKELTPIEELLRTSFKLGQQWVHDITHNLKEPMSFNEWFKSSEIQKQIEGLQPNESTFNKQIEELQKRLYYRTNENKEMYNSICVKVKKIEQLQSELTALKEKHKKDEKLDDDARLDFFNQ